MITEDDYIDYLGRSELTAVVPVALAAKLRRSHFLFLGYEMADWNLRLILNRIWGERPGRLSLVGRPALAEPTRAGVLAAVRRDRRRRRPGELRRAAGAAAGDSMSNDADLAVQGAERLRGHRARRAPLLRTRARDGDRRGQPHRLSAHRPLRAERRREVVVAARRSRALAPGAAGGAARRRLLELERRSDSRSLRGGGRGFRALDERLGGDGARAGAVDA